MIINVKILNIFIELLYEIYLKSSTSPIPENYLKNPIKPPPNPIFNTNPTDSNPIEGTDQDLINKGKLYQTTLAEFNGYMPYRHEFEDFYHKDAEKLVENISFDPHRETERSFYMKVQNLICYNSQVAERMIRVKTIEDFDIGHIELANDFDIDDLVIQPLKAKNESEKMIDKKLISLGQYIGAENTINLANCLHQRLRYENDIKNARTEYSKLVTEVRQKNQNMINDPAYRQNQQLSNNLNKQAGIMDALDETIRLGNDSLTTGNNTLNTLHEDRTRFNQIDQNLYYTNMEAKKGESAAKRMLRRACFNN